MDFDALLILSFGGPEGPDDVMPFLRNVTRGRNVPDERLAVVAEQYAAFGGRSPINDHNRALKTALEAEFEQHGHEIPVYWGNRNWEPYVTDVVAQMAADGVRHALVYATSAFGSYSGCRQYREDLTTAIESLEASAPTLDKLRLFYNHPGFLQPVADRVREAVASHHHSDQTHPEQTASNQPAMNQRAEPRHAIVFTAHSLPQSMAAACDYEEQLNEAAGLVMELLGDDAQAEQWQVVYQSRSGPPHIPWLEPDVGDHLEQLRSEGIDRVTVVPLGFVSDHMEVLFDLDTQAAQRAEALGLEFRRAATVGHDQQFLTMIRQLVEERIQEGPRLYLGQSGPWPDMCPEGHCLAASGRPT